MDMQCDCGAIVDGDCACTMDKQSNLSNWGSLELLLEVANGNQR